MKKIKFVVSTLALSMTIGMGCAQAFGLGDALSVVGGSNTPHSTANASDLLVNTNTALITFTKAQLDLAEALGGYEKLSAQRKQVEAMKSGDISNIKDTVPTVAAIDKDLNDYLNQQANSNVQLDATQKKKAGKAMIGYAQGLVSSRKMVLSLQDVAKNPMSLGQNAGAVLTMVNNLPGIISSGTSTTTTMFKYLTANGVDTSAAQNAMNSMGK